MTLDERLRRAALGVADRVEPPYVDIGAVRDGAAPGPVGPRRRWSVRWSW